MRGPRSDPETPLAPEAVPPPPSALWQRLLRRLAEPRVVVLGGLILSAVVLILLLGEILAPLIAATVVAYLLQGPVDALKRVGLSPMAAVLVVFVIFVACVLAAVFALIPLLIQQLIALVQQLPAMVGEAQRALLGLPEKYPKLVSPEQVNQFIDALQAEAIGWGQYLLGRSVSSLVFVATTMVYVFLVPFLVFFLLKDSERIRDWLVRFLPRDHELAARVWHEVDRQLSNYIRGKFWEILVIAGASCFVFVLLGLPYAVLLGVVSGLSLLVPYIGVIAAAVPVIAVAYFQWGLDAHFLYAAGGYAGIHLLDANILAPLLLSEVTDLHPVAIVLAILFFGGIWGVWGLFFAVPLATAVQALLRAWPSAASSPP